MTFKAPELENAVDCVVELDSLVAKLKENYEDCLDPDQFVIGEVVARLQNLSAKVSTLS